MGLRTPARNSPVLQPAWIPLFADLGSIGGSLFPTFLPLLKTTCHLDTFQRRRPIDPKPQTAVSCRNAQSPCFHRAIRPKPERLLEFLTLNLQ